VKFKKNCGMRLSYLALRSQGRVINRRQVRVDRLFEASLASGKELSWATSLSGLSCIKFERSAIIAVGVFYNRSSRLQVGEIQCVP
jgi:hypothetical protein